MAIRIQAGAQGAHCRRFFSRYRYIAACVAVSMSGCYCRSDTPPEVPSIDATTSVEAIEVTPSILVVAKPPTATTVPVSFQLVALLRDKHDLIIPASIGNTVSWQAYQNGTTTDLVTLTPDGHSVIVEIPVFPANDKNVTIKAKIGTVWSDPSALINLVANTPATGNDIILSSHTAGETPNVALVNGEETTTTCLIDEAYVFVYAAILADLVGGCDAYTGEVAVFSPDRQLYYEPEQAFAFGQQTVNTGSPDPEYDTLPVKIWSAAHLENLNDADLLALKTQEYDQAVLDVELASDILEANRVGIVLELVENFANNIEGDTELNGCPSDQTEVVDSVLNIYVVAVAPGFGAHCRRTPGKLVEVIFLMQTRHSPALLAHEIGHALGLWKPGKFGHTEDLKGFGTSNVMLAWEADDKSENRDQLSLGQGFRMNVDEESWLNHSASMNALGNVITDGTKARDAALIRLQCQCETYNATPCPKLAKDFLSPDTDTPPGEPWRCADNIYLGQAQDTDDAVGLLRGRRQSEPGACEWVAGLPARHNGYAWGKLRLEFPNLAESACTSQDFAVFFTDHRMWYRPVPSFKLSYMYMDLIELTSAADVPGDPWSVPVVLWFEGGMTAYQATEDVAFANQVYSEMFTDGTSNRAGITLTWTWNEYEPDDWTTGANPLRSQLEKALDPMTGTCNLSSPNLVKNAINVYFLGKNTDFDAEFTFLKSSRGTSCADPPNGTYVIALANPVPPVVGAPPSKTGLAHYLGHLFTLPEDPATNHTIMRHAPLVGAQERAPGLTLGQVFRLNVNEDSWLNTSAISNRKGQTTEKCAVVGTLDCPPIDMHVTVP
ncbi:MAG: hypothetical protein O7E49_15000 [Gemmatimonadetes bacterium]|nr:hypothetical protein [Gemmatimonadota bacterium]